MTPFLCHTSVVTVHLLLDNSLRLLLIGKSGNNVVTLEGPDLFTIP